MYLCRTCGGMSEKNDSLKQLFTPRSRTLLAHIRLITGLELERISGLPYHMCKKCYEDLDSAMMFRRKCIETEYKFMSLHEESRVLDKMLNPLLDKGDSILDAVLSPSNCTNQNNNKAEPNICNFTIVESGLDLDHDGSGANSTSQMETTERLTTCINEEQSLVKVKNELMSSDDDEDLNQTNNIEFDTQNILHISQNNTEIDSCDDYHQNISQCNEVKSKPIDTSDTLVIEREFELEFVDVPSIYDPFVLESKINMEVSHFNSNVDGKTMNGLPEEDKCKEKAKVNVLESNQCDMNFMSERFLALHERKHDNSTKSNPKYSSKKVVKVPGPGSFHYMYSPSTVVSLGPTENQEINKIEKYLNNRVISPAENNVSDVDVEISFDNANDNGDMECFVDDCEDQKNDGKSCDDETWQKRMQLVLVETDSDESIERNLSEGTKNAQLRTKNKQCKPSEELTVKNLQCTLCKTKFHSDYSLELHTRTLHKSKEELEGASNASRQLYKTLSKKSNVQTKRQTSTEIETKMSESNEEQESQTPDEEYTNKESKKKRHNCEQCDKSFKVRRDLQLHMLRHSVAKDFECEHCKARFCTLHGLKMHARKHTEPFKCRYCDDTFSYNSSRKRHERLHTNERPFECKYCAERFICATSLKDHQVQHTGELNYHCTICDIPFFMNGQLYKHTRSKMHMEALLKLKKDLNESNQTGEA